MTILPCCHKSSIIRQIEPTVRLLSDLDELHPEVLKAHQIEPHDYKGGLVFRSAVERIRGSFIASSSLGRQGMISRILEEMKQAKRISDYDETSKSRRYDFTVVIENDPDYFAAIEVKGGEGNSINISDRPKWAKEFYVWCHLDGAVVNQPSHGIQSILNRISNELVRRKKHVDAVFVKDALCGTSARPCPKYTGFESTIGHNSAPDIFLMPIATPTARTPKPRTHSLSSLRLPQLILQHYGVNGNIDDHIWSVEVHLDEAKDQKFRRIMEIYHKGEIVGKSVSRAWNEN